MLIAQLTDTHVVDPASDEELFVDNNERLRLAIASINAEQPEVDLVLITGDLTNNGRSLEFDLLAETLADLTAPVLAIPGNHDTRAGVRRTFADLPWTEAGHASWAVDVGDLRIIGLDTTIPTLPGGEFDEVRAEWLEQEIAGASGRCVLAMHHPPFATGIEWMDRSGFEGLDRLTALLARHPVERILCGHLHRPIQSTIAAIPAQVGLSTVQHVDLDLMPDAPVSLILDPVGYLLHHVTDDGWVTHTRYFDTGAERIHPAWATID